MKPGIAIDHDDDVGDHERDERRARSRSDVAGARALAEVRPALIALKQARDAPARRRRSGGRWPTRKPATAVPDSSAVARSSVVRRVGSVEAVMIVPRIVSGTTGTSHARDERPEAVAEEPERRHRASRRWRAGAAAA